MICITFVGLFLATAIFTFSVGSEENPQPELFNRKICFLFGTVKDDGKSAPGLIHAEVCGSNNTYKSGAGFGFSGKFIVPFIVDYSESYRNHYVRVTVRGHSVGKDFVVTRFNRLYNVGLTL